MSRPDLAALLRTLDACGKPLAWASDYGPAWNTALASCTERRWLTWLACALMRRGHLRREVIVLTACACARTALHHVPAGEERPLRAIETAERWCRGEATIDELREARRGGYDAYDAAAAAAYAYAYAAARAYADDAARAYAYAAAARAYAAAAYAAAAATFADDATYAYAAAAAAAADDAATYAAAAAAAATYADAAAPRETRAESELLAITRRELGAALLDGLTAYAATLDADAARVVARAAARDDETTRGGAE